MARDSSFTLQELLNLALENGYYPGGGLVSQSGPLLEDGTRRLGFHQLFHNGDLDSGTLPEDLIPWGGEYTFPAAAIAAADIDIVSSSDEDGAGTETGASAVKLIGLDTNWMWQEEVIELNGTTDVHPVNDYLRFNRLAIVGGVGSEGSNVGTITLDDGTTQYAGIGAGGGIGHFGVFTVPADYKGANLVSVYVALSGGSAGDWARGYVNLRKQGQGWWHWYHITAVQNSPQKTAPLVEKFIPAKSDIRLNCTALSADNSRLEGRFELVFIP